MFDDEAQWSEAAVAALEDHLVALVDEVFPGRAQVLRIQPDGAIHPPLIDERYPRLPTFRGPVGGSVPVVLTVHDLAVLRAPEAFPRWHRLYGRAGLQRVLEGADAVVAVSEFTKGEVVDLVGIPADRIRVVPNGVDPVFRPATPSDTVSQGEYVLAVSTLEPRKNLARAVEAAKLAGVELRVVGARGWGGVEVPGWVGEVPDAELAALYRGARCLLYPSLYEGFGVPVFEAMACGTPVVTSRGTAMEEVAGGAAVLVDPLDVQAIADGIEEAAQRRDELVGLGLARAREFTWESSADSIELLWRELA